MQEHIHLDCWGCECLERVPTLEQIMRAELADALRLTNVRKAMPKVLVNAVALLTLVMQSITLCEAHVRVRADSHA